MNPAAELIYVLSHHFTAQEQRRHQCLTTLQRSFLSLGCGCTYSVNLLKCLGDHMASAQHLCSGDCVQQMRRVNDTMSLEEKLLFRCGFTMQSPIFNYTPWDKRTSVFLCSAARLKKKFKVELTGQGEGNYGAFQFQGCILYFPADVPLCSGS